MVEEETYVSYLPHSFSPRAPLFLTPTSFLKGFRALHFERFISLRDLCVMLGVGSGRWSQHYMYTRWNGTHGRARSIALLRSLGRRFGRGHFLRPHIKIYWALKAQAPVGATKILWRILNCAKTCVNKQQTRKSNIQLAKRKETFPVQRAFTLQKRGRG